ncbi:MAG TPA: hypothetical protein VKP10_14895 [Gemmatimonadales bacterium]|nr:hypothetical protein [Gemmatimonadales bacterium]
MLIDRYLPRCDASLEFETTVDAPGSEVYRAIREADLRDPIISALFALRELPQRLARRLHGQPPPPAPPKVTFGTMIQDGPGWTLLDEQPDQELVVGSVGRFWERDYGGRTVTAEEFVGFTEPGYAKLVIGFSVRPGPTGESILRYEARTLTTDDTARRKFRRYWRLIRPGVSLVMRAALRRIKLAAEHQGAAA